jgi:MoaA/NifB/PqqE/SkfB family radical SAM enzyme
MGSSAIAKTGDDHALEPSSRVFWTKEKLLTRRGVLWLGQTCNIRCHFCYFLDRINDKDHAEHAFMGLEKAKKICHDLRFKYGNTSIDIQGGEPTIWRHINALVTYCAEIGLMPTLITNAIALAKIHKAQELKAAGIQDLLISVHGFGETYDKIVGMPGGSEKQLQAIGNCIQVGIPFRFNAVLSKRALPQYEQIARFAVEKGARVVNILAFNPFGDQAQGGKRSTENVARYSEVAAALNRALDILEEGRIEANVRYFPICMVEPRHRKSIYNFPQLSYDGHEWDYNSWHWTNEQPQRMKEGDVSPHHGSLAALNRRSWVYFGTRRPPADSSAVAQEGALAATLDTAKAAMFGVAVAARDGVRATASQLRQLTGRQSTDELGRDPKVYHEHARVKSLDHNNYRYAPVCQSCDARSICDGFHGDYADIFGWDEAHPIKLGKLIEDPAFFIREQAKVYEPAEANRPWSSLLEWTAGNSRS